MKLIKADKNQLCFEIQEREKQILFKLLGLYPLVPAAHQKLSRKDSRPEAEEMLNEALAAQRGENKLQVERFRKTAFRKHEEGYRVSVKRSQMEWLLQVLNDIRVGSWLVLGSPDGAPEIVKSLTPETAPHFWAMEMAGGFQHLLLRALEVPDEPEPPMSA